MKFTARFLFVSLVTLVAACAWNSNLKADDLDEGIGPVSTKAWNATALLYAEDTNGTMDMKCTATAFERDDKDKFVYRFVTASHCLAEDDTEHERAELESEYLYLSLDKPGGDRVFHKVKVLAVGYQHRGDDFAVLELRLPDTEIGVMPLADHDPELGERLVNIAGPAGYGKQLFLGHVSNPKFDRPAKSRKMDWTNAVLVQMDTAGGSSGSAMVSVPQKGIVAIHVGSLQTSSTPTRISLPVSRFKKFWSDSKAGKYKWYKPDPEPEKK